MLTDDSMSALFSTSNKTVFPLNNYSKANTSFLYLKDNRVSNQNPHGEKGEQDSKINFWSLHCIATLCKYIQTCICTNMHKCKHKHTLNKCETKWTTFVKS